MLHIGNLAKTYHILPSDVLTRATTFDLMIYDVMTTWENSQNNPQDMRNYNEQELTNLVRSTRQ